jgi:predicted ester cyclase
VGDLTKAMQICWEAMEARQWDRLDEVLAPDLVMEFPGMRFDGPAAFKEMARAWFAAFSDLTHETVAEFESDGNYACRLRITGTHDGTFVTPMGEIPATGRKVEMLSADYVTGVGDRIKTWHAYPDMAGLVAQIT